jgi:hypothetical protein
MLEQKQNLVREFVLPQQLKREFDLYMYTHSAAFAIDQRLHKLQISRRTPSALT